MPLSSKSISCVLFVAFLLLAHSPPPVDAHLWGLGGILTPIINRLANTGDTSQHCDASICFVSASWSGRALYPVDKLQGRCAWSKAHRHTVCDHCAVFDLAIKGLGSVQPYMNRVLDSIAQLRAQRGDTAVSVHSSAVDTTHNGTHLLAEQREEACTRSQHPHTYQGLLGQKVTHASQVSQ